MKNREKYKKIEDAFRAYTEYSISHWNANPFSEWLDLECEGAEATKEEAQKPQASSSGAHADFGMGMAGLGMLYAMKVLCDSDPWLLAKSMQGSANAEVREYGYRMELAINKERNSKRSNSTTETAKENK